MVREVIHWLEQLIPEIKAGAEPKGVLLKFAHTNNLAPALLEKLAHVYNTAKTLHFLEKSADRGASFTVLDASELLQNYTQAPAASTRFDPDGWTEGENVIKAASDTTLKVSERFPRLDRVSVPALEAPAPLLPLPSLTYKRAHQEAEFDQFTQLLFELRETAREKIAAVADCFRMDPTLDFAAIEADYRLVHGEEVVPVFNVSAKQAARARGRDVSRAANAGPRRLVDTRHPIFAQLDTLRETLGLLKTAALTRAETFDGDYIALAGHLNKQASLADLGVAMDRAQEQGSSNPSSAGGEPSERGEGSAMKEKPRGRGKSDAGGDQASDEAGDALNAMFGGKGGGGGKPLIPAAPLDKILQPPGPGYNAKQEKVDTQFNDLETKVVLERLLANDPVISEADENRVVSLANSIWRQSPEIAKDINAMRSVLREALQYDSLPIHTFKDLATTQKTVAETRKLNRDEATANYGARKPKREAA